LKIHTNEQKIINKNMAKTTKNTFGFDKLSNIIENISKKSVIMIEKEGVKKKYISTGVYILNALLSKSILQGGVTPNRITIMAGPPQTGKSFICYNIARNAQKEGYNVIYIDTEFSVEISDFELFGVDTSNKKFMLLRSNKVEDLKVALSQVLNELKEQKGKGVDIGKTIIFIDSIGQLASNKEVEDAIEGKNKVDMSRAKAIKSLFRIISSDLGYLQIPLVCTNHIYMTQDMFPKAIMSGGEGPNYSASTVVYLSIAKLKTGEEDEMDLGSSGVVVTAKARKNRLAKPKQIKFEIDHTKGVNPYCGLEMFCTLENFDRVGIAKAKPVVDKKTGEITYEASNRWYVKHLDKQIAEKNLFNSKVFTKEVLKSLDEIITKYFTYSSYDECQKELERLDEEYAEYEKDTFDIDSDDDSKLFDTEEEK
jgi:RecA/RadA recombinase